MRPSGRCLLCAKAPPRQPLQPPASSISGHTRPFPPWVLHALVLSDRSIPAGPGRTAHLGPMPARQAWSPTTQALWAGPVAFALQVQGLAPFHGIPPWQLAAPTQQNPQLPGAKRLLRLDVDSAPLQLPGKPRAVPALARRCRRLSAFSAQLPLLCEPRAAHPGASAPAASAGMAPRPCRLCPYACNRPSGHSRTSPQVACRRVEPKPGSARRSAAAWDLGAWSCPPSSAPLPALGGRGWHCEQPSSRQGRRPSLRCP
mmetsp:Transcript_4497/g.10596  ORF Transcript_4497/g.10596 Transcript_4497/m.10596 type:complete len:258 (-) Transcript_4497:290-1063(-)